MVCDDFTYNNKSLSDFNMIMCDPNEVQTFVSREIIKTDQSSIRPVANHFSTQYLDVLPLNFFIIKNTCTYHTQNEFKLTGTEINELRSWLESPQLPMELITIDNESVDETYYYGIFNEVQPFTIGSNCYGLYLTFTCNSPYGYSSPTKKTYNFNSHPDIKGVFINESSEQNVPLYPLIKIYSNTDFNNTTFTIKNQSDNNQVMSIVLPTGLNFITVDCNKKQFVDQNGNIINIDAMGWSINQLFNSDEFSTESYSFYWLRLLYGMNKLEFTASSDVIDRVEIHTQFIRKAGGF